MTESNCGNPQRLYRFSLYVKKRDDMTAEEFGKHWSTSHPPLVQEWMVKYGIVKYVQVSPICRLSGGRVYGTCLKGTWGERSYRSREPTG
jgi:hypothetical protein